MFTGKRNLPDRHDAPTRSRRSDPTAKSRSTWDTCRNDPPINNANPARNWTGKAIPDGLHPPNARIRGHYWVIKIDDHDAVIGDPIGEKALHAAVRANAAVAIKVINSDIREHTHIHS
jgi:hypothetical protein